MQLKASPNITFCCPTIDARPWAQALAKELPSAHIQIWPNAPDAADYAITWSPTQGFFDAQPQLKAVFALGAGMDALLRLKLPASLPLVRIEDGGMAAQMQDYVTHALLRHVRRFDDYAQDIRNGHWNQYEAQDHSSFPVGVLGMGELGSKIAERVRDLGFPVAGWSRTPKAIDGIQSFSDDSLAEFLSRSRVLICALPLTAQTQDILNEQHLSLLQPGAFLINVARGAHLVEADLLKLLDTGHVAGACLDVLRTEPAPADHPFRTHPRITLTPHIAALTLLAPSIAQISQKIRALQSGQSVSGIVQRDRGY
jgi:glyoxylate/hydroxypyruvate reductase